MHAKIALSWQEKRASVAPIHREILILARNPDSCRISGVRKGFHATEMPISCHESAPGGSSGYRNADFLPSAEARTLSWTACAAPKSATLPLLSLRFLMGRRKGERPVPSPLASHRPERQHDGESAPSPRLRRPFTPPTPSATPTPSPCLYLPPCPPFASGRATGVHQAISRLR